MKKGLSYILIVLFLLAGTVSCIDEDTGLNDIDINQHAVDSYLLAQAVYDDFIRVVALCYVSRPLNQQGEAMIDSARAYKMGNGVIMIDYGDNYIYGSDSRLKKGHFTLEFFGGSFFSPGSGAYINLEDFYISQNRKVKGRITLTCLDSAASAFPVYSYELRNGIIDYQKDGKYEIAYATDYVFYWENLRQSPEDLSDDSLLIVGKSNGRSFQFDRFFNTIRDTLVKPFACKWIKSGHVFMSMPDLDISSVYLNYSYTSSGDTSASHCDPSIWYSVNGINSSGMTLDTTGKRTIPY